MDAEIVRWLASPAGWSALRALPPHDAASELALHEALRADGFTREQTAALMHQSALRARARAKFGEFADGMLLTDDGLEQATRIEVSAMHAGRYAAASLATVHDLGCGVGADAMTMSALGVTVVGVDIDPATAAIADANLRPWPDSRAHLGRAEDFEAPADPLHSRVGVFLDPARRLPGISDSHGRTRRIFRLDQMSPSWDFVCSVAAAVPAVGAKLSPSFPHDAQPLGTEAQWVSWNGDLVECGLWWGPLVRQQGRTALILRPDRPPVQVDQSMGPDEVAVATGLSDLGPWLYEPDHAVTRAGLLGAPAAAVDGLELDPGLGYLTSQREVEVEMARRYAVTEAMPFNAKALRAWLRSRNITGVTIKKRGIRTDEAALRKQLGIGRGAGSGASATIVLTRVAGQSVTLVVEPR